MKDCQFKLRAHHGMCIAFFGGKGYSNDFISHMSEVIHSLESDPVVCICAQADLICSRCPNNEDGICSTESKVAEYDQQVLSRCGLTDGVVLRYSEFREVVFDRILLQGQRENICGSCQWTSICHFSEKA